MKTKTLPHPKRVLQFLLVPLLLVVLAIVLSQQALADSKKFNFEFKDATASKVIQTFAKKTGKKVVGSSRLHGNFSIHSNKKVTADEAFSLMSAAFATEGLAFSKRGETYVLMKARNIQRSSVPVVTELPPIQPEQMVTYVIKLNNVAAESVYKRLRILPSKDGELVVASKNELVLTDWVSNLHRVKNIIEEIDHK